jgi:hypothetical protein
MKKAIHEFEVRFDDNERDDKNLRPAPMYKRGRECLSKLELIKNPQQLQIK